jgi:hypothetical protein
MALRGEGEPTDFLGSGKFGGCIDEELVRLAELSIRLTKDLLEAYAPYELFLEERVKVHSRAWGTADLIAIPNEPDKNPLVLDFKSGFVEVDVEENPQLLSYAVAARLRHNGGVGAVDLCIIQPTCDNPVKVWTAPEEYLDGWLGRVDSAIQASQGSNAECIAGDHCKWCKAKAMCPAQVKQAQEVARTDFATAPPMEVAQSLSDEQLKVVLEWGDRVKDWIDSVKELAVSRFEVGDTIEGFKLIQGRGRRKWGKSEAHTAQELTKLGVDPRVPKLKTITAVEAEIGKGHLDALTINSPGNLKVVPEAAPGLAIITASNDFIDDTGE